MLRFGIFTRATKWPSLASPYPTGDAGYLNNFLAKGVSKLA